LYYALNRATAGLEASGGQAVEAFAGLHGVYLEASQGHEL